MTSGHKREIVNTRERVRSTDQSRLQAFLAADRAEYFRFLFNLISGDVDRTWNTGQPLLVGDISTTVDTPLRGDVFEGLVVTPIVGTQSVHVSPGIVGLMDPDGQAGSSVADPPSPDDSPHKIVFEPDGVQTNGVLIIDANAGPGDRIDIIECRRSEQVLETDVRAVFDPSTGTASNTVVDKVGAARLEFRVRQGTAGAGFPGTAQGWLPLAVAHIPSGGGATTNDVDFWDVRPYVKDRIRGGFRSSYSYSPPYEMQQLYGDIITGGAGETRIGGDFVGQLNGYFAGGTISRGTPGADQAYIDAQDSEWQETGFTVPANGIVYFWLLFPYGLPRWVRYNRTAIGGLRFPHGMRGIPVISATGFNSQSHDDPAAALNVPDFLDSGIGTTTTDAVCVVAFTASALDTPGPFVAGGEWVDLLETVGTAVITPPSNGTGNSFDNYTLIAGTHFPRNARKVRVVFVAQFNGTQDDNLRYSTRIGVLHGASRVSDVHRFQRTSQWDSAGTFSIGVTAEIERPPEASGYGPDLEVQIEWNALGAALKQAESATVVGWKQTG